MNKLYYDRIIDIVLERKLSIFGAVNILGPKWVGKTTTAEMKAKSKLKLQNNPDRDNVIETIKTAPNIFLDGEKPRLIDEWQDAPNIWDAVRCFCDDNPTPGNFILTGSSSAKVETAHSGIGRITNIVMHPMSLYESKNSNGLVSLKELFDGTEILAEGVKSDLSIDNLIMCACRGGWPFALHLKNKEDQLEIAKDYFKGIYTRDIYNIDRVKRNQLAMKTLLESYARNIATLAKTQTILDDIKERVQITKPTLDDYIDVLERLYIIEDIYGWAPQIRSRSILRTGRKRLFCDPSLAVVGLNASPEKLRYDLNTFGYIFENLCIRDLKVYSLALGGEISYYHDQTGLEADAVLHLDDGRYALIEFKLGSHQYESAAKNLHRIEKLIINRNEESKNTKLSLPTLKIIITGSEYGYRREDGVYVIPIGCLKD